MCPGWRRQQVTSTQHICKKLHIFLWVTGQLLTLTSLNWLLFPILLYYFHVLIEFKGHRGIWWTSCLSSHNGQRIQPHNSFIRANSLRLSNSQRLWESCWLIPTTDIREEKVRSSRQNTIHHVLMFIQGLKLWGSDRCNRYRAALFFSEYCIFSQYSSGWSPFCRISPPSFHIR